MILIRADANKHIGAGHVMRCLSIAHAFIDKGEKVIFVTADYMGDRLITQEGFENICLNSNWADMESEMLYPVLEKYEPDLLLIDSYYVTENYFNMMKNFSKVAYIDDLNKKRWDLDYLINYNIFANVFDYSGYEGTQTKLLLNPRFAPLRSEFKHCSRHDIKDVTDVLVSAGGADPEHVTERIMSGICAGMENVTFHFVVGSLNPDLEDIKRRAEGKNNIILHINEKHMAALMKDCDIAISAAGTTLYELCATGIPTITYTMADNQLPAAKQFYTQGIMLNAGDCRVNDRFIDSLKNMLEILNDKALRAVFSERMQSLVDGNGARRIVDVISGANL